MVVMLGAGSLVGARAAGPLPVLTGPPLVGPTHLSLVVGDNRSPPFILDVDSQTVRALPSLGIPARPTLWSPQLSLTLTAGRALAVVTHQACAHCAISQTNFLIGADGSVQRSTTLTLTRHEYTTPAFGSTRTWVLTWPHGGGCTLRLVPGARRAVGVPCGTPGSDTASGLWLGTGHSEMLLDPLTGRIRERVPVTGRRFDPLHGDLALESIGSSDPTGLTLVNLATGSRKRLTWPSILHFSYQVFAEPNGPLVAVWFGDPAYPGPAQAVDVWLLDTTTGKFSHVPGFPAQQDIKFSHIAWTSDHRLVVVSQSGEGTRTVLGVWTPGQGTLPVLSVPTHAGGGYYQFVPLTG
jgi:hypothetical protein